jgi:flavin reductase (DIM6/NTAB) family NADH-FMN oxidoreductase RutF
VAIITTIEPDGRLHGMTANGVTSVSLSPPLALASVGHDRNSHPLIQRNGRFGLSILAAGQESIARHFTVPPAERPADATIPAVQLGSSSVIAGALAAMDCRVVARHDEGDHTLFVAEVEHVSTSDGEPLVWYRGGFTELADPGNQR